MQTPNTQKHSLLKKVPRELEPYFVNLTAINDPEINEEIYNLFIVPYTKNIMNKLLELKGLDQNRNEYDKLSKISFLKKVCSASVLVDSADDPIYDYFRLSLDDTNIIKWRIENLLFAKRYSKSSNHRHNYLLNNAAQKLTNIMYAQFLQAIQHKIKSKPVHLTKAYDEISNWVDKEIKAHVFENKRSLASNIKSNKKYEHNLIFYLFLGANRFPFALEIELAHMREIIRCCDDIANSSFKIRSPASILKLFELLLALLQKNVMFSLVFYRIILTIPQELDYLFMMINEKLKFNYPNLWSSNEWFILYGLSTQVLKLTITALLAIMLLPTIYSVSTLLLITSTSIGLELLRYSIKSIRVSAEKIYSKEVNHRSNIQNTETIFKPLVHQYNLKTKHHHEDIHVENRLIRKPERPKAI